MDVFRNVPCFGMCNVWCCVSMSMTEELMIFLLQCVAAWCCVLQCVAACCRAYDINHRKRYIPEIYQVKQLGFSGISRYKFKLNIWFNLNLYRGSWVSGFGGFLGGSVFSGIYHLSCYMTLEEPNTLHKTKHNTRYKTSVCCSRSHVHYSEAHLTILLTLS